MIQGIGALHDKGLVHKDIKTPNTLINGEYKAIVCDFGLVEEIKKGGKIKGAAGTPSTWAPEVAKIRAKMEVPVAGVSADWWSVGIVIYQMMYMKSPFDDLSKIKDGEEKDAYATRRRDNYQNRLKDDKYIICYEEENKEDIHEKGLGLAKHYSKEMKELVQALLVRDPTKRLGHDGDSDAILAHPAFKAIEGQNSDGPQDADGEFSPKDGSPDDKGVGFDFKYPNLFNLNQDFEKKRAEKDLALDEK